MFYIVIILFFSLKISYYFKKCVRDVLTLKGKVGNTRNRKPWDIIDK